MDTMLEVLSYNIQFGQKLDEIIAWLNSLSKPFDILCFQEFPKAKLSHFQKSLKDFSYTDQYASSFIRKNNDYGELTLIHNKKISLLDSQIVQLGTSVFEQKLFGLRGQRSALFTKLSYNENVFYLVNTHLIAFSTNKQRRGQLSKIIEQLDQRNTSPVLILGDFNYTSMVRQYKLLELLQNNGFTNGHKEYTHKIFFIDHQLDYLFYKSCKIRNLKIPQLTFSDHLPMIFSLQV